MRIRFLWVALMAAALTWPAAAVAAIGIDVGGGCADVKRQITRDWGELKSFFRPGQEGLKRPRSREMYCVSPAYTRDALPKSSVSAALRCYAIQGRNFCCDRRLEACAGL